MAFASLQADSTALIGKLRNSLPLVLPYAAVHGIGLAENEKPARFAGVWEMWRMAAKLAGSGGSKYSLGQNSEINVTPFVDILLVLLIIFMVAVPMATVSIRLDLPPATPPPPDVKPIEPTFVSIQKDGGIYIADTQTSLDRLAVDLEARMKHNDPTMTGPANEERVMIRADADVLYNDFMAVVNQLQTDGFYKVGLINEDIT